MVPRSLGRAALILALLADASCAPAPKEQPAKSPEGFCNPGVTVRLVARKFAFDPPVLHLALGTPVTLELTSVDRVHGFDVPELGVRTDIVPDHVTRIHFVPDKTGTFAFHCDVFCGVGHDEMSGEVVVER